MSDTDRALLDFVVLWFSDDLDAGPQSPLEDFVNRSTADAGVAVSFHVRVAVFINFHRDDFSHVDSSL